MTNFVGESAPGRFARFVFRPGHAARRRVGFPVFLRIDERAKLDDVRDGIEVVGVGIAAQPQRLQRNRAAAGKHIQHTRTRRASGNNVLDGDGLAEFG
ncbi:MAG: hypothetical protein ACLQVW_00355 [Limisphaerales bacterium]